MKRKNIAILGATGAVGREMLKILGELSVPSGRIVCFSSERSRGTELPFRGGGIATRAVQPGCFSGIDIVLGAVEADVARGLAPEINADGAVFIDNSSAFRLQSDVPLIVPEINGRAASAHKGIIANPNCSTIITLMAIWPVAQRYGLKALSASTYQAVSGAGLAGVAQLEAEMSGMQCQTPAFAHPIAMNVIPAIGSEADNGYTSEEQKLKTEGRKILSLPGLAVSCTCVRVPVMRCHSISASISTSQRVSAEEARRLIDAAPGVAVRDDLSGHIYPMPADTGEQDTVFVGRIRPDETRENGLALWCCGDQLRKGAATNAVQIAALL